jgi:hypothetical protein
MKELKFSYLKIWITEKIFTPVLQRNYKKDEKVLVLFTNKLRNELNFMILVLLMLILLLT